MSQSSTLINSLNNKPPSFNTNTSTHQIDTQVNHSLPNAHNPTNHTTQSTPESIKHIWQQLFRRPNKSKGPHQKSDTTSHSTWRQTKLTNINIENLPLGDILQIKAPNQICIVSQNVNGIKYDVSGSHVHKLFSHINEIEADVACFQEIKLDTRKYEVRNTIKKVFNMHWYHHQRLITSPSPINIECIYKHGGTIIISRNMMTNCAIQSSSDKIGHWTFCTYLCKHKYLTIISPYQVCKNNIENPGPYTRFA